MKQTWNERLDEMKMDLGWDHKKIAEISGHTYNSVKSMTAPNAKFPRWLKVAIVVYEVMKRRMEALR